MASQIDRLIRTARICLPSTDCRFCGIFLFCFLGGGKTNSSQCAQLTRFHAYKLI